MLSLLNTVFLWKTTNTGWLTFSFLLLWNILIVMQLFQHIWYTSNTYFERVHWNDFLRLDRKQWVRNEFSSLQPRMSHSSQVSPSLWCLNKTYRQGTDKRVRAPVECLHPVDLLPMGLKNRPAQFVLNHRQCVLDWQVHDEQLWTTAAKETCSVVLCMFCLKKVADSGLCISS